MVKSLPFGFSMSKTQFRLFVLISLGLSLSSGFYDQWVSHTQVGQVNRFIAELQLIHPDTLVAPSLGIKVYFVLYGLTLFAHLGLLCFARWSRQLYVLSFILIMPSYYLTGLLVASATANLLYDASMICAGGLFTLIFYSPVARYFPVKRD